MHELSMAQGIIDAVLKTAEENDAVEVTEVSIEIGRLAMINPEQLRFMLSVLVENTIVENAKIEIEEIPVEIDCPECGFHGNAILDDLDHYAPMVSCPKCDNKRISILMVKIALLKILLLKNRMIRRIKLCIKLQILKYKKILWMLIEN